MTIYLNNHEVQFIKFPNNETRLDLDHQFIKKNDLNKVMFIYVDNNSIFELLQLDDVLHSINVEYELFIPYMPYSRMDRIQSEFTAFSLKIMGSILKSLHYTDLYTLDAHSDVTYKYTDAQQFNYSIHDDVLSNVDLSNAWIVFPDKGAQNRYDSDHYPNVIVCEKKRDFKTGQILGISAKVERGNATGDLFIIDDLCSKGGTFIGCMNAINQLDVDYQSTNLIISHAEKALNNNDLLSQFDTIYCTNSIYDFNHTLLKYLVKTIEVKDLKQIYFGGHY